MIRRSSELSKILKQTSFERVLCHSDLHAGNILIDEEGRFYIVD